MDVFSDLHFFVVVEPDRLEPVDFQVAVVAVDVFHDAGKEIGVADECCDKTGPGRFIELRRSTDLLHMPAAENRDMIADAHCLLLIMGDEDECDSHVVMDRIEFDQHSLAQFQVKRGKRFVEKKDFGFCDQCAGDCDPLALSAAELCGFPVFISVQLNQLHIFRDLVNDFPRIGSYGFQAECDILPDGHMREERVILENCPDRPSVCRLPGDIDSVQNHSSGIGRFKAAADTEQRGFPTSARPQQGEHFACIDRERHIVEDGILPVSFRYILKAQNLHFPVRSPSVLLLLKYKGYYNIIAPVHFQLGKRDCRQKSLPVAIRTADNPPVPDFLQPVPLPRPVKRLKKNVLRVVKNNFSNIVIHFGNLENGMI